MKATEIQFDETFSRNLVNDLTKISLCQADIVQETSSSISAFNWFSNAEGGFWKIPSVPYRYFNGSVLSIHPDGFYVMKPPVCELRFNTIFLSDNSFLIAHFIIFTFLVAIPRIQAFSD